jgi:oxaloacetate decarboxylase alpha subunit
LKGEYGRTPAPVNKQLQVRVLSGAEPITCRPADLLKPEMDNIVADVQAKAAAAGVKLAENVEEDALIYALFAQIGWKFLENRGNPAAFEPAPNLEAMSAAPAPQAPKKSDGAVEAYTVSVDGRNYNVIVAPSGALNVQPGAGGVALNLQAPLPAAVAEVTSPLAGNILRINVGVGQHVNAGDVVVVMEAMKMETEVRSKYSGTVSAVHVREGAAVTVGTPLISL